MTQLGKVQGLPGACTRCMTVPGTREWLQYCTGGSTRILKEQYCTAGSTIAENPVTGACKGQIFDKSGSIWC